MTEQELFQAVDDTNLLLIEQTMTSLKAHATALMGIKDMRKLQDYPCPLVVVGKYHADVYGAALAIELARAMLCNDIGKVREILPVLVRTGGIKTANFFDEEAEEIYRSLLEPTPIS
ncbi:MAG: hypothetical protein K1Y36_29690 [Blastocatellia bacterium]|nr:hypothetical protein [Blastocatellia bacterium]